MPTISAVWDTQYPTPVARLLRVIARSHKGKKGQLWSVKKARDEVAMRLERFGYALEVNGKIKTETTMGYGDRAAIITRAPFEMSIEFSKHRPEIDAVKRLINSPGVKVLVLSECGYYHPQDGRGDWHKVKPEDLSKIDYLIGSRSDCLVPQLPEELVKAYIEHDIDTKLVLEMIDKAWAAKRPLSGHGNVMEFDAVRYLPKILVEHHKSHPIAAAKVLRDLKEAKLIETAKEFTTTMRGFRLTELGKSHLERLQQRP